MRHVLRMTIMMLCATLLGCGDDPGGGAASTGIAARDWSPKVTRDLLDQSLQLGRRFLLANQLDDGRFRYEFDFTTGVDTDGELSVRRAGTLWAMSLIHRDAPTPQTRAAVERGIDFWLTHSRVDPRGRRFVDYPGDPHGSTGTQALVCLSIIDALPALDDAARQRYTAPLRELIDGLLVLRMPSGRFFGTYAPNDGAGLSRPSPYADGEALLALVRYARHSGDEPLRDLCIASADAMRHAYVAEHLAAAGPTDGVETAFYQWGTLAYVDIFDADWPQSPRFGELAIDMTRWMIRAVGWTDDALVAPQPHANSAWVLEGVIPARDAARRLGHDDLVAKLDRVIDDELHRITTWQLGSPIANDYLNANPPTDDRATGGVMSGPANPVLRLDYTQHQMHAVLLARRYIYTR